MSDNRNSSKESNLKVHVQTLTYPIHIFKTPPSTRHTGPHLLSLWPCGVQNCPIAHRTGEPCTCGVQNCPPHTPNRQTVPLRCAELPDRTPNRRTVPVQNCPIAHRTGEPCPCGVQNCPIAHLDGGGKRAHALHFIPDLIRNLGLRKLDPETSSR